MGKGLQNVVNSWVNVNNNHVVFPGDREENLLVHEEISRRQLTSISSQHHDSFSNNDSSVENEGRKRYDDNRESSNRSGSLPASSKSGSTGTNDPSFSYASRSQMPGRLIQQKTRSKLKRTNSQSDLLKERAASRRVNAVGGGTYSQKNSVRGPLNNGSNHGWAESRNLGDRTSSIPSGAAGAEDRSQKFPFNTGQYINENAFANQHRSMQLAAQQMDPSQNRKGSIQRNQAGSDISTPLSLPSTLVQRDSSSHLSSAPEKTRLDPLTGSLSSRASREPSITDDLPASCNQCKDATARLLSLEADLEHLRATALNREYVCISCEKRNNLPVNSASSVASGRSVKSNRSKHSKASSRLMDSSVHSVGTRTRKSRQPVDVSFLNENLALAESSQRFIDLTARHKRQIEHISRETARWQNDMHLKLSKLAMMCKDFADESAKRKEQVEMSQQELHGVREERNAMSSEVEILRARVALYEKQEAENVEIRRMLRENENEALSMADEAISDRDAIIEDLTLRLQISMDLLEKED